MNENDIILKIDDVTKRYAGVVALNKVTLSFRRGEIHALVGENGAGKSTAIKVMAGAISPTSGQIYFEGNDYKAMTPKMAIDLGIATVYQELNLLPFLSVAENIFYNCEMMKGIFIDKNQMLLRAREILDSIHVKMDPRTRVGELGIAYKQIVEIARAVSKNCKVLIMDEPTSPLTRGEIEQMNQIIRKLKENGVTIIYISHRLEEVFDLCDRVSVLRDGEYITTKNVSETDRHELISLMVGRRLEEQYPRRESRVQEPLLRVEGLSNSRLKNVSFELKKGELLGFGGLMGAGRTEMVRALFGADPIKGGEIWLKGKKITIKSPVAAIRHGLGLIPEERKTQGVFMNMDVRTNVSFASLSSVSKLSFINKPKERQKVSRYIADLQIKTPNERQLVKNLSGGNQQKVVLAKWLATQCDILLFDEPTRGIDVKAKQEIYHLMNNLLGEGKSIIMISSELPELLGMSDRIIVMHEGAISGELNKHEATQERVLALATGILEKDAYRGAEE